MKKNLIFIIIICFLISGCNIKKLDPYKTGIKVTSSIENLIKDETYMNKLYKYQYTDYIASDYDTPQKVYEISKNDVNKTYKLFLNDTINLSDEAKNQIRIQSSSFINVLNVVRIHESKTDFFATSFNYTAIYKNYKLKNECAYLYIFETGKPILVHFSQNNHNIYVNAWFFLGETTLSNLRDLFNPYGCEIKII